MRTQPRQELLDIWQSVARTSWSERDQKWIWGGRFPANSIGDAEQLLCILLPATKLKPFALDNPNLIGKAMAKSLRPLGAMIDIPMRMIDVLLTYYQTYTDAGGRPTFPGGAYFSTAAGEAPTQAQLDLDVVDSFAMSITLSLATIGFLRVYRTSTGNDAVLTDLRELEKLASNRLTAAMVGLLRSFSVNVFTPDSKFGSNLLRTINQSRRPTSDVIRDFQNRLLETTASFREILLGSAQEKKDDLARPDRLWECGWSWGVLRDAPPIRIGDPIAIGEQVVGVAQDAPWLYFTAIAMDAIEDLFSERTRVLGLLNEEQQRLARALQLRSDLTRSYWATIATFDSEPQWPIEDIPWRTTDDDESDYYTLQVTSFAVKNLLTVHKSDAELQRISEVLRELANRARITRRPSPNDQALELHSPGLKLTLNGSETLGESSLTWHVNEFAPLLLQRVVNVASLVGDSTHRSRLLELADRVWDHLVLRRSSAESLWDRPAGAFAQLTESDEPTSWYFTERVVQALVVAARTLDPTPLRSDRVTEVAGELVNEADHLFDHLQLGELSGTVLADDVAWISAVLARAREVLPNRPGTAAALATSALIKLNELTVSGDAASEVM